MKELVNLWEEFEEWYAQNWTREETPTPSFAEFIAWYRDVYPLKSPLK